MENEIFNFSQKSIVGREVLILILIFCECTEKKNVHKRCSWLSGIWYYWNAIISTTIKHTCSSLSNPKNEQLLLMLGFYMSCNIIPDIECFSAYLRHNNKIHNTKFWVEEASKRSTNHSCLSYESTDVNESRMESNLLRLYYAPVDADSGHAQWAQHPPLAR